MKHNFEKLKIWQDSLELAVEVNNCIKNSSNFALRDQLVRSSLSVPSNIAEGCERQTVKEILRYLAIAAGSSGEARTQLIIAARIGDIDFETANVLVDRYRNLSASIYAFRNSLQ